MAREAATKSAGRRRIGLITTARSDYATMRPLIRRVGHQPALQPVVFCAGMHLVPALGNSIDEIVADGFHVDERIEMLLAGDSPLGLGKSLGLGTIGFAEALARQRPDILVLSGDRIEMLAVATAALALGVAVAHVSGGDITDGAFDNQVRHALTKLAHLHFVALPEHGRNVLQMGEEPWRVTVSGDPALDTVPELATMGRDELSASLGIGLKPPLIVVSYHPATLGATATAEECAAMLRALAPLDATIVITYPNADPGHETVIRQIEHFAATRPGTLLVPNLGQRRFYSLLALADLMVGNSSSGIWEAPSFRLPVVSIGERQEGRQRAGNVIDAPAPGDIAPAIARALDPDFRRTLADLRNPYGDGRAAERIVAVLKETPLGLPLLKKRFVVLGAKR
jgi:UDP-hydrolysing UDP-N-acetyl-D-glucosamine 2-epimerase